MRGFSALLSLSGWRENPRWFTLRYLDKPLPSHYVPCLRILNWYSTARMPNHQSDISNIMCEDQGAS